MVSTELLLMLGNTMPDAIRGLGTASSNNVANTTATPVAAQSGVSTSTAAVMPAVAHDATGQSLDNRPVPAAGVGGKSLLSLHLTHLMSDQPRVAAYTDRVAKTMIDRILELKDLRGTGVEQWGSGDPGIAERQALDAQLMMQNEIPLPFLTEAWFQQDGEALKRIERTDVPTIPKDLDSTYDSWGSLRVRVELADTANAKAALEAVEALADGSKGFVEANPQMLSTQVIDRIADGELRARSMMDLLLQFRAPEDTQATREKMFAGAEGVQAAFELRDLARNANPVVGDPAVERDYAMRRAVALANPRGSSNAVLEARHVVSALRKLSWAMVYGQNAKPEGCAIPPYSAIHHNFSTESPKIIRAFIEKLVFAGGSGESFATLVEAMGEAAASEKDGTIGRNVGRLMASLEKSDPAVLEAFSDFVSLKKLNDQPLSARLEAFLVSRCKAPLDSPTIEGDATLTDADREHLTRGKIELTKGQYPAKLTLAAKLFRLICNSMPSAKTLATQAFSSFGARPLLADVDFALNTEAAPTVTLKAITDARLALRSEFGKRSVGFERMAIWSLDRQLELLASTHLGSIVDGMTDLKDASALNEALAGLKLALDGARISGLDQIRDFSDPLSNKAPTLKDGVAAIDALYTKGEVEISEYRDAIAIAYEAIVKTTENIRSWSDRRAADVQKGRLLPNPAFSDDFVKEGPLHYARAIAQKAMAVGLETEMSPTRIINPPGVTSLNRIGRVVFDRVLLAENMSQLKKLGAKRSDFCFVRTMDEKKMLAVGGVMSNFPGGYCHAAVYARGAGMAALSNPEIGANWEQFIGHLGTTGDKLYFDDSNSRIVMMPFGEAVKAGLARADEADKLKPGANRHVEFVSWQQATAQWETIGTHDVQVNPERPTYNIKIYTPAPSIRGLGEKCMSFQEAGALGIDGRGLGGEKNTVLAMMSVDPMLAPYVPPGGYMPSARCFSLMAEAGVLQDWLNVYEKDPLVGQITDVNFLASQLYTDADYREGVRATLNALVKAKAVAHLVAPDGQLTTAGKALTDEIQTNIFKKEDCANKITRSSFSAEDRPFKSGAGQYDSFPNCRTPAQVLVGDAHKPDGEVGGIVGVLASAWERPPIENNVIEEYNLAHIAPSVTIMKCMNPRYSGVAVTRDTDNGHRRTTSYQLVKGFGGGVENGITEEGRLTKDGQTLKRTLPGVDGSMMEPEIAKQLFEVTQRIEQLFHDKIEAGKGYAVDIEWVFDEDDKKLYIVQARTVRV